MSSTGHIDSKGRYIRGVDVKMGHDVSPQYKGWSHDLQRKEFSREIIQPHVKGKPNPKFIQAYPEYSKKYFTDEQIKSGEREI